MPKDNLGHDFFEMIKNEHCEIRGLLSQVQAVLNDKQPKADCAKQLVSTLYERLQSHFHHEEAGGYLSEALERAPRLADQAGRLFEQHETLSEALGELRDYVQQPGPADTLSDATWWKGLADRFQDFSKQLLKHESEEDRLVQEAFNRDVGTCG